MSTEPMPLEEAVRILRRFLADGELPCTCAGTVDGDPTCLYCNAKEDARQAVEDVDEHACRAAHVESELRDAIWAEVQTELLKNGMGSERTTPRLWEDFRQAVARAQPANPVLADPDAKDTPY